MSDSSRRSIAGVRAIGVAFLVAAAPGSVHAQSVPKAGAEARPAPERNPVPEALSRALEQGILFLLREQNRDGSWGGVRNMTYLDHWANVESHRSWQVATTGLVVVALLRHGEDESLLLDRATRAEVRPAIERGVAYLAANHDLRRCDDWDIDDVWGLLYGLKGLANALADPRFAASPDRAAVLAAAKKTLERVAYYQSPTGGWAYYADQVDGWRPQWSTSFTTAAMIDAIVDARAAGLEFDARRFDAAVRAVARCRLPGGAYTYDVMGLPEPGSLEGINDLRGSLCRVTTCNFALVLGGKRPSEPELARACDGFFRHHVYLDCARMRPIPHEAYHLNAGYFYLFGHFYFGELLPHLPTATRRQVAAKLAAEVAKTQDQNGAFWDYWMAANTKCYGTAFATMTIGRCLEALANAP